MQCFYKFVSLCKFDSNPVGFERHGQHSIRRRQYINLGPHAAWHYDKLKHWGFPIHGAIDGYSRRILWLKVTSTNNLPDMIGLFYI